MQPSTYLIHYNIYKCNRKESQTWLIRHYKFILAEDITILSILSDDFLHAFLAVAENDDLTRFEIPSDYTIYTLNVNFYSANE